MIEANLKLPVNIGMLPPSPGSQWAMLAVPRRWKVTEQRDLRQLIFTSTFQEVSEAAHPDFVFRLGTL